MAVQKSQFPGCCGIICLYSFPAAASLDDVLAQVKDHEDYVTKVQRAGLTLIALTATQLERKGLGAALRKMGYKNAVKEFYNPRHATHITLLSKRTVTKEK